VTDQSASFNRDLADLIEKIQALPDDWHGVGSVNPNVLRAIARHAQRIGKISNSVETGSGKTTLLFSHLSAQHLVFALDEGDSISKVRTSPLFNADNVTFIEGLTQVSLPRYSFPHKVQIALIDGPHGYPFPDLEYFYFYPILESGGLLLIDDIKIPTIRRMFEIVRADDMFELIELVDDNTAFFRRTEVPCVSLTSDSWWRQGYNKDYYRGLSEEPVMSPMHSRLASAYRFLGHLAPGFVRALVPKSFKEKVWRRL